MAVVSLFLGGGDVFLGLDPWHMEVPRLGVKLKLQLPAYTTAHGNAWSLTHWAMPRIEPASSWILIRFVSAEPWWELHLISIAMWIFLTFLWDCLCLFVIIVYVASGCLPLGTARSTVSGSCDSDGVHIIRGHSLSSTPLVTLCGDEALSPVTISGPVLLNFYSNAHTTDFGFKFSYRITRE